MESACEVFAKKGFRDATIAEICSLAGTNIAAVNYHFRNKKTLYIEAWRQAFHKSLKAYPPDGGVGPDEPVEKQLYGRILSIMRRFANPDNYEFEIIQKEMANPTGLLAEIIHKTIEPFQLDLLNFVRQLVGRGATEKQVMLCARSILTQCFDHKNWQKRHKMHCKASANSKIPAMDFDIEEIAEHVTRFSLGGISEIRRQNEKGKIKRLPL